MRVQHVLIPLAWQLHGHGIECTHASRSSTVLSELAFAVSPPGRPLCGACTGHGRSSSSKVRTPVQQRFEGLGRHRGRGAQAAPTAATKTSTVVRLEPLDDHRKGKKNGSSRAPPPPSSSSSSTLSVEKNTTTGSQQRQRKRSPTSKARAPRKKGVSRAAVAAAAVDPFPEESSFVTRAAADGGTCSGLGGNCVGGTVLASIPAPAHGAIDVDVDSVTGVPATAASSPTAAAAAAPAVQRKKGGGSGSDRYSKTTAASSSRENTAVGQADKYESSSGLGAGRRQRPTKTKQKYGDLSAKRAKALRTGGKAFLIVCDAESYTFPELVESIDLLDELGTRDVGVVYADWRNAQDWRSEPFGRSKARDFKLLQRDPLAPGSNPLGDDTMTADVVALARAEEFKKYEFCLLSGDASLSGLAARLRQEGRRVRGIGRRQAPKEFLDNCDAFMYIDPANRYELLDNEGLVISVALCIALAAAAAGQERCDWVRMKTIVNSLHAWDLGLESPNFFGYCDYDEVVVAMDTYVTGVEDTSGEVVVKVPPKPKEGEVPRGLEDVATYLYQKWVSFTKEPQMNDILLACIPACLQALSAARAEMDIAVKRFQRDLGEVQLHSLDFLRD